MKADTLFDIAPEEPERERAHRKHIAIAPQAVGTGLLTPAVERRPLSKPIGEIEGEPCAGRAFGAACGTTTWDIYCQVGKEWIVGCWVCGDTRRMPVVAGHLPDRTEFVVSSGRGQGMTFDQIALEPRGIDTIKCYSRDTKQPHLQKAAAAWLDAHLDLA